MVIRTSEGFEKEFRRLSQDLKVLAKKKLKILLENPSHPSLRVKKVHGYHENPPIMEMSVTMSFRVTFQRFPEFLYVRHIGTHAVFRKP